MVDMRCLCKAKLNMTIRPFHCLFNIWFVPAAMVFNILKKKGKIFINFWGNLSVLLHKIYLMRITRTSSVCGILWSIMVYPAGEYTLYRSWTGGWIAGLRLHHQADAANYRNRDRQAETRPVIRTDKQRHVPSSGQTNRDMSRHPDRQTETRPVIGTNKQRHVPSSGQKNRDTSHHPDRQKEKRPVIGTVYTFSVLPTGNPAFVMHPEMNIHIFDIHAALSPVIRATFLWIGHRNKNWFFYTYRSHIKHRRRF